MLNRASPRQLAFNTDGSRNGGVGMFAKGAPTICVKRAPIMSGLNIPASLQKPFVRPFKKRNQKAANNALKTATLGQRKRSGMAKLLGNKFRVPGGFVKRKEVHSGSESEGEESESEVFELKDESDCGDSHSIFSGVGVSRAPDDDSGCAGKRKREEGRVRTSDSEEDMHVAIDDPSSSNSGSDDDSGEIEVSEKVMPKDVQTTEEEEEEEEESSSSSSLEVEEEDEVEEKGQEVENQMTYTQDMVAQLSGSAKESAVLTEIHARFPNIVVGAPESAVQDFLVSCSVQDAGPVRYTHVQLKTAFTASDTGLYKFTDTGYGGGTDDIKYDCIVVCVVVEMDGPKRWWWVCPRVRVTSIGVRIGEKHKLSTFNGEGYADLMKLLQQTPLCGYPSKHITDITFFSDAHKKEHMLTYLIMREVPGEYTPPPEQNSPVDYFIRLVTNPDTQVYVQFKSACLRARGVGVQCASLCKTVERVPYDKGDNDYYVFGYVDNAKTRFYVWMVPENTLITNGYIGFDAKMTLHLHVPLPPNVPEGEVKPLTIIRKDSLVWTAEYFVGSFLISDEEREALNNGEYLEDLVWGRDGLACRSRGGGGAGGGAGGGEAVGGGG
ncbi:hypothetical protein TrCOL_g4498 [Triparma columacea]|uniref:Uncharacterized protein n=1 Tax=Triparma columacea TaxID=722753 RepID=A0A9W7GAS6_9STRA|nr:hypothetical protein TrCOL_g4498 [Triparma columacea]